jgi:hypothetical protein
MNTTGDDSIPIFAHFPAKISRRFHDQGKHNKRVIHTKILFKYFLPFQAKIYS